VPPTSRIAGAAHTARGGYDRAIDVLDRFVPVAARIVRLVRFYGFAVALAAVVIVATLIVVDVPGTVWTWGLLVVLAGALLVAPVVILLFASMLDEALTLPAQFKTLPDVAPTRARELATLAAEATRRDQHERPRSLVRDSWKAGRLLNALRREVPGISVLLSIARLPFIVMVLIAMVVGLGVLFLAPAVVFVALVLSVV
jgi:hypothetical protein